MSPVVVSEGLVQVRRSDLEVGQVHVGQPAVQMARGETELVAGRSPISNISSPNARPDSARRR